MSSGGGSSSGKVDYPAYMKDFHGEILGTSVSPTQDVLTAVNTAWNSSPYAGEVVFNPDVDITAYENRIATLETLTDAINPLIDWQSYITGTEGNFHVSEAPVFAAELILASLESMLPETISVPLPGSALFLPASELTFIPAPNFSLLAPIAAPTTKLSTPISPGNFNVIDVSGEVSLSDITDIDAFLSTAISAQNAQIDASIEIETLPRFQAGMRDINAVHSSAFIIGQGVIESQGLRDKNSFSANLRLEAEKQRNSLRVQLNQQELERADLFLRRAQVLLEENKLVLDQDRNLIERDRSSLEKDKIIIEHSRNLVEKGKFQIMQEAEHSKLLTERSIFLETQKTEHNKLLLEEDRQLLEQYKHLLEISRTKGTWKLEAAKIEAERERLKLLASDLILRKDQLRIEGSKDILHLAISQLEFSKLAAHLGLEGTRIKNVMKKEELDAQLEIDAEDTLWNLNLFKFANNALSSISGAAPTQQGSKTNKFQSALGGAVGGAAMGGMMAGMSGGAVGGPAGMAIGGAIGLGASLL